MHRRMPLSRFTHRLRQLMALLTMVAFAFVGTGCFNTYELTRDEYIKLQRPDEIPKVVRAQNGQDVLVGRDTALYVRSLGGRRYPVTPFNFKLTQTQLVASDRDTLLMTSELQSYEVDHLSTGKTLGLIAAGLVAVGSLIAVTVASAGEKSFSNE